MPLELLLPMVILGVALTLFVTHALGGSTTPRLEEVEAQRAFAAEHPGLAVRAVRLDRSGRTAVVFTDDGQTAIVTMLGDHPAVRFASEVIERGEDHLRLRFSDVGFPARDVHLRRSDDGT